jgi:hypothetical protein
MNVEQIVLMNICLYPSLFTTRWGVYEHLFATNGNGYVWRDGELKYRSEDEPEPFKSVGAAQASGIKKVLGRSLEDESLLTMPLRFIRSQCMEAVDVIMDVEARMEKFDADDRIAHQKKYSKKPFGVYFSYEYSALGTIPDDIKPDWLEAARCMAKWMFDNEDLIMEQSRPDVELLKKDKHFKDLVPNGEPGACKFCGSFKNDDPTELALHVDSCLYNPKNKECETCKHVSSLRFINPCRDCDECNSNWEFLEPGTKEVKREDRELRKP